MIEIKFLKCIIFSLGSVLLFSNVTDIWHLLYCIFDIVYSYYLLPYNTETWNSEICILKMLILENTKPVIFPRLWR